MTHDEDKDPEPTWLQQSPIDVVDSLYAGGLKPLSFCYPALVHGRVQTRDEDPGFSFLVDEDAGAYLMFDGQRCALHKIHVHARSEHRIASADFPLEVHLVHKIPDPRWGSQYAVVAVFVDERSTAAEDARPFSLAARSLGAKGLDELTELDPNQCLPPTHDFYRYEGSLTTPAFAETVSWILLREPLRVVESDLRELKARALHHARSTRPSNRRFVLRSFP